MTRLVNVVGARPQFIKYFPVSKALAKAAGRSGTREVLVHTGQHYDYSMSKIFFDEFGIKEPEYHLGVGSASHGAQTGEILRRCEEVFSKERPDAVIVYGDTNSTVGAALAASKMHIPVAHVEAGLRSFNKLMPEEVNRVLTDHVSTFLFCPSRNSADNLRREGFSNILNGGELIPSGYGAGARPGINGPLVANTGDVMYDALIHAAGIAREKSRILDSLGVEKKGYCLLTIHRAESTDDGQRFEDIAGFVERASSGATVIFPMHPRTRKAYEGKMARFAQNVRVTEPVGYFDLLTLIMNASLVMTDSGGVQKEAYWLKTPCITLRGETEWVETVESGWNVLYRDYRGGHTIKEAEARHYGDGLAAERIVRLITGD